MTTTARERTHFHTCPDVGACRYIGGMGSQENCLALDRFLDDVEEQRMHQAAEDLRRTGRDREATSEEIRGGWFMAAYRIDPYVQVPAYTAGSGAADPRLIHPDCKRCETGAEHWHRKSDGKAVEIAELGAPAFRGGLSEVR